MKKLLALILCVMMFVAVIPTAAFAANQTENPPTQTATWVRPEIHDMMTYKAASDAISHAKANIDYLYGTLTANTAVFGTVKTMDDVVNGLVTDMFAGTTGYFNGVPVGTIKDNVKMYMKDVIGGSIIDYMYDNWTDFATESVTRKANTIDQALNAAGTATIGNKTFDVYRGPAGALYLKDGNKWYHTNSTASRVGDQLTTAPAGSGSSYTLTAGPSSLTFTGNTIYDTNGKVNYVYTGANGQIYLLGPDANGEYKNWGVTTSTMKDVLDGNATFVDAYVTVNTKYKYDPIKYAQTFADAVNDAFTSKEGAANLEAVMYQLYSAKVWKDVNDQLKDLADDISIWENGSSVLDDYHFHEDLFTPFAFMNQNWLPEGTTDLPSYVFAP
jgi:hypothetical protein